MATSAENHRRRLFQVGLLGVLLIGTVLRFYELTAQKLWLDELYTAELVHEGLGTIWHIAFVDITSPLATWPFWLGVQIGGMSALSLRLVSALASLVALLAFCRYATLVLERKPALVATGLFAIAPLGIYYAQEARPYALGLMGIVLTLLAYERLRRHSSVAGWALYALLASLAAHFYYLNIVLIAGQLLALLILAHSRRRVLLGGALTVAAIAVTLAPFSLGPTNVMAGWTLAAYTLRLPSTIKTMMAGDVRFASSVARNIALAVLCAGLVLALADRRIWRTLLPHALQLALAILVAFVLLPLAGRPAPAYDERAFLMLLPSALLGFSLGIQSLLRRRAGHLIAIVLVALLGITSLASMSNYFNRFEKSPEAQIAEAIALQALPGNTILTHDDAYQVDAAVRFYQPELPVYRYYREEAGRLLFLSNPSILKIPPEPPDKVELGQLAESDEIWLVYRRAEPSYLDLLRQDFAVEHEYTAAPFRALLLRQR